MGTNILTFNWKNLRNLETLYVTCIAYKNVLNINAKKISMVTFMSD